MKTAKGKEPPNHGRQSNSQLIAEDLQTLRFNPFTQVREVIGYDKIGVADAERDLLTLRQLAAQMDGRRIAIFAMPKSGSSFVRSAIGRAAKLPTVTLTSIPADGGNIASYLGINGREQEIDELALILQTHRNSGNWVAHHHTRFTPYLARQLAFFKVTPVVVVRNILDAIVSMDDMIMSARRSGDWAIDTPHALPLDYPELDRDTRLMLLARDFGIWLIKFLVSWKRAIEARFAFPLIISYEEDVLNLPALGTRLSDLLG
ncbi:MAG: hypothetical protein U1D69_11120, partial [Polynucleobacter sp.]|nr:hypothetical protein [Polynucleobacter sp.]